MTLKNTKGKNRNILLFLIFFAGVTVVASWMGKMFVFPTHGAAQFASNPAMYGGQRRAVSDFDESGRPAVRLDETAREDDTDDSAVNQEILQQILSQKSQNPKENSAGHKRPDEPGNAPYPLITMAEGGPVGGAAASNYIELLRFNVTAKQGSLFLKKKTPISGSGAAALQIQLSGDLQGRSSIDSCELIDRNSGMKRLDRISPNGGITLGEFNHSTDLNFSLPEDISISKDETVTFSVFCTVHFDGSTKSFLAADFLNVPNNSSKNFSGRILTATNSQEQNFSGEDSGIPDSTFVYNVNDGDATVAMNDSKNLKNLPIFGPYFTSKNFLPAVLSVEPSIDNPVTGLLVPNAENELLRIRLRARGDAVRFQKAKKGTYFQYGDDSFMMKLNGKISGDVRVPHCSLVQQGESVAVLDTIRPQGGIPVSDLSHAVVLNFNFKEKSLSVLPNDTVTLSLYCFISAKNSGKVFLRGLVETSYDQGDMNAFGPSFNDEPINYQNMTSAVSAFVAGNWFFLAPPQAGKIDEFLQTCPTREDVQSVDKDLHLYFDYDPTGGRKVCSSANGSADLTLLQERAYQSLLAMKKIAFSKPLPWTPKSVYDWFIQDTGVKGIRFSGGAGPTVAGLCCDADHNILISIVQNMSSMGFGSNLWISPVDPPYKAFASNMLSTIALYVHEGRHSQGFAHDCGSENKDANPEELSAYGAQYYFDVWMSKYLAGDYFTADEFFSNETYAQGATKEVESLYKNNFCDLYK